LRRRKGNLVIFAVATRSGGRAFQKKRKRFLEHFNIENVEMLWRRAPPPAPQA
jgi:hypothetical protein